MAGKGKNKSESYAHLSTREAILLIVENQCALSGPESVMINDIARELGIRPPSLYSHFPSRDAIFASLAERGIEAVLATFEGLKELPADAAMRSQIAREITLFADRPGLARLILADIAAPGGRSEFNQNPEAVSELLAVDAALFKRGVSEGVFRSKDAQLFIAVKVGAILNALMFEWFKAQSISPERIEELAQQLSEWILSIARA